MARKNKLGTTFLGLGLDKAEEESLKREASERKVSAKAFIRFLYRKHLTTHGNQSR